MKKLYIMCGLPGSGKSRWTMMMMRKKKSQAMIVSKDKIREMVYGEYQYREEMETVIRLLQLSMITTLSGLNVHIIVDETNISVEKRSSLIKLALQLRMVPVIVYVKGNGNNLKNRMTDPRGYSEEKWHDVIESMRRDFEVPTEKEGCRVIVA